MTRTPEQSAADEALTAAIEQVQAAYHGDDVHGVLTEYVVLAARQYWNDDGDPVTQYWFTPRDDCSVPIAHLVGLCDFALTRYRKIIAED